jgi:hypothetical protein
LDHGRANARADTKFSVVEKNQNSIKRWKGRSIPAGYEGGTVYRVELRTVFALTADWPLARFEHFFIFSGRIIAVE